MKSEEWKNTTWMNQSNTEIDQYPRSCYDRNNNLYSEGCLYRLEYVIGQSAMLLGAGAMTIAFTQVWYGYVSEKLDLR